MATKTSNETYGRFTIRMRIKNADGSETITTESKAWPEAKANRAIAEHLVEREKLKAAGASEDDLARFDEVAPTFDRAITAVFHEATSWAEVQELSGSENNGVQIWNRAAVLKQQQVIRELVVDEAFEVPEGSIDMAAPTKNADGSAGPSYLATEGEGRRKQSPEEKAFNLLRKSGALGAISSVSDFQELLKMFNEQNAAVGNAGTQAAQ